MDIIPRTDNGGKGGAEPGAIKIHLANRKVMRLTPDNLDRERLDRVRKRLADCNGEAVIDIGALPRWEPAARADVLATMQAVGQVRCRSANQLHAGLLDAVLAIVPDPKQDLDAHEAACQLVMEVIATLYPQSLRQACTRWKERLAELGAKGERVDSLTKRVKGIAAQLNERTQAMGEAKRVKDSLPDAPVGPDILVPPGYELTAEGIVAPFAINGEERIDAPVLVQARHIDAGTDLEYATLAWRREGGWKTRVFDRSALASTRRIVDELSQFGIPVTSLNAAVMVRYIAEFMKTNMAHLTVTHMSSQLGWQGDGVGGGFLLGRELITPRDARGIQQVRFHGKDEGDDQIAAAFHTGGTLKGWLKVIKRIKPYPRVRLALYASFVPPVLQLLKSGSFTLDLAGRTTTGKTTALRIAASSWGNPNEHRSPSIVKTWDSTSVFRERLPAVQTDLPVFMDDSKYVRDPAEVARTLYSISQGLGRGRGTQKGTAAQASWNTVLMTTGEQPIVSFTEDGGTRGRVLAIWGSPFESDKKGNLTSWLNAGVDEHFGHAGRSFIKYLLDHADKHQEWIADYQQEVRKFRGWASEVNSIAGRMAPHFAAIATAAWLAHQALDLPWEYEDPIKPLWDELANAAGEADRAAAGLRSALSWAHAHQTEFDGRRDVGAPQGGWAGRWDNPDADHTLEDIHGPVPQTNKWKELMFIPDRLRKILEDAGFSYDATIRDWADRGWIRTTHASGANRRTVQTRIGHEQTRVRVVAIRREAAVQVMEDEG